MTIALTGDPLCNHPCPSYRGLRRKQRATARRCFCPPESMMPANSLNFLSFIPDPHRINVQHFQLFSNVQMFPSYLKSHKKNGHRIESYPVKRQLLQIWIVLKNKYCISTPSYIQQIKHGNCPAQHLPFSPTRVS